MPFGPLLEEKMFTEDGKGNVTCKRCGHTWRCVREPWKRRCYKCKRALYPAPRITGRCHPICRKGTCFLDFLDFMVVRQVWWATPGSRGIVWKLAKAVPTTVHELMLKFERKKPNVKWFLQNATNRGKVARRFGKTLPPEGIDKFKKKGVSHRRRRATLYQYFPTHWAMVDFLTRHPDAVTKVNGEVPIWQPMTIRKVRTLVKFSPTILPRTPAENREILEKIKRGKARNDRRMGYPLPTLPQSGL